MRKSFFFAALAIAAAVSCTKELPVAEQVTAPSAREGYVQITLSAGTDATKATLDGKTVLWKVGEEVAVYPGEATTAEKFTVKTVEGNAVTISGEVPEGTTSLVAVYPYDLADGRSGNNVDIYIPESQDIPDGMNVNPFALVSAALYQDITKPAQFKNLFSLVAINPGNMETASVLGILAADDATAIAGEFKATLSAEADPVIAPVEGGAESGVELFAQTVFAPNTTYYAVVAPCTLNGFTTGIGCENKIGTVASEKTVTLARNKGVNLGDISKKVTWKYTEIRTGEELKDFLATADTYTADETVKIGNDLDLSGITIAPAASWAGTFDGQGYILKNWTSDGAALFTLNTGTIKDFTIGSSCVLNFPATPPAAFAFVACNHKGTMSGITNNAPVKGEGITIPGGRIAVIAGLCDAKDLPEAIVVSNCINNGNVTITTTANTGGTQYIGTIVGSMGNSTENVLADCANNGKLSITCSGENTKNFYIGGVAGGTTNGSNNIRLKNTGDVTFKCAGHEAALCLAGITSYTTGILEDCENTGSITFDSDASLKATFVSGIAGYFASNTMTGCTNRGAITVKAARINGRNGIGDIASKVYNGTNAITAGLTIGGLVSATGKNPEFVNSNNYGKVSLTLTNPTADDGTHTAARPSMGGLVGDCAGPMTGCNNYGDVTVHLGNGTAFTARNAGYTLYVGGIVGSSYNFAGATTSGGTDTNSLNKFTLENCNNSGDVSVYTDNEHGTNHAVGGIVGWPQSEDKTAVYVAKNCTNSGDITFEGRAKVRIAGIHGGTGRMDGCKNTGKITFVSGQTGSVIASVAAFHSQAHTFSNCVAGGTVEAKSTVNAMGGLTANLGNVAFEGMDGCSANCTLIGGPEAKTALVVGLFNGTDKAITLGSETDPIEVAGTVNGTAVTSGNYADYLYGTSVFNPENHAVYGAFGN